MEGVLRCVLLSSLATIEALLVLDFPVSLASHVLDSSFRIQLVEFWCCVLDFCAEMAPNMKELMLVRSWNENMNVKMKIYMYCFENLCISWSFVPTQELEAKTKL